MKTLFVLLLSLWGFQSPSPTNTGDLVGKSGYIAFKVDNGFIIFNAEISGPKGLPFLLEVSGVVSEKDHKINLTGLPSKVTKILIPRSTEGFLLEVTDFQSNGTPVDQLIADKGVATYSLKAGSYTVNRGTTSLLMD